MPRNLDPEIQPVYDGMERVISACLTQSGSLFSEDKDIWTIENVEELYLRFNLSPDESSASFVEKLSKQLDGAPDDVVQLMAEVMWLHFACAADVSGTKKREHIDRILGWMKQPVALPEALGVAMNKGMASTGVAFNTMRPQQLWFLIEFVKTWKGLSAAESAALLEEPWAFKSFLFGLPIDAAYLQRNALLHLIHPETFEDIWSRDFKSLIAKAFKDAIPSGETDIDKQLVHARAHVLKQGYTPESRNPFWWNDVWPLWKPSPRSTDSEMAHSSPRRRTWLLSPGKRAADWDRQRQAGVMCIGWHLLEDLSEYPTKQALEDAVQEIYGTPSRNPHNTKRAMVDTRFHIKPGDLVIAKRGRFKLIAAGVVRSEYRYAPNPQHLPHEFEVDWFKTGEWDAEVWLSMKTLTELTRHESFVAGLLRKMGIGPEDIPGDVGSEANGDILEAVDDAEFPPYGMADALSDLFIDDTDLEGMVALLKVKKNLVLTGPPGTGKTFLASRLGYLLAGEANPDRICRVQFHQSMSYEDFVQGYRPAGDGFKRRDGPFVQFCNRALQDDRPYILLIDEINRGNLSRIFGELMLLIESDKRSKAWATRLAYADEADEPFWVPANVYIVGTMNTADRSLALVDYALRRRFAFWAMRPALDHEGFHRHLESQGMSAARVEQLVGAIHSLNERIKADPNLGEGFCIGHSYFCGLDGTRQALKRLFQTELGPLLREYWFDDPERANEEVLELNRVV